MKTLYERYKIGKLPKPKNLLETLTRIQQILIKKENWVQGRLYKYDDSHYCLPAERKTPAKQRAEAACLLGTCNIVDGGLKKAAEGAILKSINDLYVEVYCSQEYSFERITDFNDDYGVTHRDILAVLNHAVKQAEAKKRK